MSKKFNNKASKTPSWLSGETVDAAKMLLGMRLRVGEVEIRITETEAYTENDSASHAVTRKPSAGAIMKTAGMIYVYRIYGIHYCLNITTDKQRSGAVLIRAGEPLAGIELMKKRRKQEKTELLTVGPGRLCQALGVDNSFSGEAVGKRIQLLPGKTPTEIITTTRIGISTAKGRLYRFYDKGSRFVLKRANPV